MLEFNFGQLPSIPYTLEHKHLLTIQDWIFRVSSTPLTYEFIEAFMPHLQMSTVLKNTLCTIPQLCTILQRLQVNRKGPHTLEGTKLWLHIAQYQRLTADFMLEHALLIPWRLATICQQWTWEGANQCAEHIMWEAYIRYQTITEEQFEVLLARLPEISPPDLDHRITFARYLENPRTRISTAFLKRHRGCTLFMAHIDEGLRSVPHYRLELSFDVDDWYDSFIEHLVRNFRISRLQRRYRRYVHGPSGPIYARRTRAVARIIGVWKGWSYRPPTMLDMGGGMYRLIEARVANSVEWNM